MLNKTGMLTQRCTQVCTVGMMLHLLRRVSVPSGRLVVFVVRRQTVHVALASAPHPGRPEDETTLRSVNG